MNLGDYLHSTRYRVEGESFDDAMSRVARSLSDSSQHEAAFFEILSERRFLPAGRIQTGAGTGKGVTLMNCFVSGTIPDSMEGIMDKAKEAAMTMRMGGGIGYDFSTLRPRGAPIKGLGSHSSGPISFMGIFDSVCKTISSAGERRGAQMAILRVDHPDIEEFINCKRDQTSLTKFNISVGVTDSFMDAVRRDALFSLTFEGQEYKRVKARPL